MHLFEDSYAKGKEGEGLTPRILAAEFPGWSVREAKERVEQRAGYDFVLTSASARSFKLVETKTDGHRTPNIAVELFHEGGHNALGWLYSSKADYILYLRPRLEYYLLLDLPRLRFWLQDTSLYRRVRVPNRGYVTTCLLMPVADLEARGVQAKPL